MKRHNGRKEINKVDGGKKRAKKSYHKNLRASKRKLIEEQIAQLQRPSDNDNSRHIQEVIDELENVLRKLAD